MHGLLGHSFPTKSCMETKTSEYFFDMVDILIIVKEVVCQLLKALPGKSASCGKYSEMDEV